MSESIELQDPLYRLIIRFSNGEKVQYVVSEPIAASAVTPDTRYGIITSLSCQNPSECAEVTVINLRDVTFIKTERVTLDQLTAERRPAGLSTSASPQGDDKLPKSLAHLKFI
ncbi:MAG TPA: hypothetical protein VE262_11765 [Blastocatellia bacterium]|nr:hypothetical protein [Blastocatellia bacterium]